jgi:hypothetical protein
MLAALKYHSSCDKLQDARRPRTATISNLVKNEVQNENETADRHRASENSDNEIVER